MKHIAKNSQNLMIKSQSSDAFRSTLFDYMRNGPDYLPFSTLDMKPQKQMRKSIKNDQKDYLHFKAFLNERDCTGKLQQLETNNTEEQDGLNQEINQTNESRQRFLGIKKIASMKQQISPYVSLSTLNRKTTRSVFPILLDETPQNKKNESEREFTTQAKHKTDSSLHTNRVCLQTKYITELSHRSPVNTTKSIEFRDLYKRNLNIVENGIQQGSKVIQSKPTSHQMLLIGRRRFGYDTPGVGVYEPKFSLQERQPSVIKWIDQARKDESLEKFKVQKSQKRKKSMQPSIQNSDDNFETLYARTIGQVKREVEKELMRNPYNHLHPNGQLVLKTVMTEQEAIEYRDQMQYQLKHMKDSINRIRNMMNMKR